MKFATRVNRKAEDNINEAISRRDFVRLGTAGAVGLGLSHAGQPAWAGVASARCDSVILLWMQGGVSHLDTFDPKPDAPAEIRGPFKAIGTNVPGIQLCEHLPRMARLADKIAFIRSMGHGEGAHERARSHMLSGCKPLPGAGHPNLGAVISKALGVRGGVPCCVSMSGDGCFQPRSRFALDLEAESEKTREAYGRTGFGRKCLLARRLVEAGTRFVAVEEEGWDHHFQVFDALRNRLPMFDRAVSALIGDLAERGLLDRTMVVFATEFGRSPRINNEAGREHHEGVFSCFLAGGGIRGGQVVGASDARGELPVGNVVSPADFVRTVYHQVGVDADSQFAQTMSGRLIREVV